MKYIKYGEPINVLVAVKGHPFDRDAFAAVFEELDGIAASFVDQPAASALMNPNGLSDFDVLVLYDMPGIDFRAKRPDRPRLVEPPQSLKAGLADVLAQGKGILALHHAIAGWPAWREYADWLGGRFLYRAGELRSVARPDSGYRHDVHHEACVVDADHPVTAGLPARFPLTDELYLFEVFEPEVTPLLRTDYRMMRDNFFSAEHAVVQGRMFSNDGWEHPPGSNLIGWVKRALNSPLVYLQPGDGRSTYEDPSYRRLIGNAIRWLASPQSHAWARSLAP